MYKNICNFYTQISICILVLLSSFLFLNLQVQWPDDKNLPLVLVGLVIDVFAVCKFLGLLQKRDTSKIITNNNIDIQIDLNSESNPESNPPSYKELFGVN